MPLFGPPDIAKLQARRDTGGLIKALRHREWTIRRDAAKALGELGDRRAVEPLLALVSVLSEPEDNYWTQFVRQSAAEALGQIGDPRAVEPLMRWLPTDDTWRQVTAADALGRIGDPRPRAALRELLKARDPQVGLAAARALGRLGDDSGIELIIAELPQLPDLAPVLADLDPRRAVEPLVATLRNHDADLEARAAAALQLWRIAPHRASDEAAIVAVLCNLLWRRSQLDPNVASWFDPRHVDYQAAEQWRRGRSFPEAFTAAADAAQTLASTWREPFIAAMLADPGELAKYGAPLSRLEDPRAKEAIRAAVEAAIQAKVGIPAGLGDAAVGPLIEALDDGDFRVRTYAALSLRDYDTAEAKQALEAYRARRRSETRR